MSNIAQSHLRRLRCPILGPELIELHEVLLGFMQRRSALLHHCNDALWVQVLLSASQDHPRVRNFHGNIPASCLHEFQVPLRGVSNDLPVGTDLWINQGEASVDIDILADPADVSTWLIQLSRRPRQTPLPSPAIIMSFQFFRFGHKLNCDGKKITHDTQSQNF